MTFNEVTFDYGPVSLNILAGVDLDALLTDDLESDRIPYWAVIWDTAFALARWVVDRNGRLGTPVLELGCGTGLVGLAAACLGARVTQTDLFLEATALARANAERNGLFGVEQLTADWRAWPLPGSWPVILGSDITYERASHEALLDVLGRALAPEGVAYLADPGRPMTLDFLVRAERAGWKVEIETASPSATERPVFIYRLTRQSPPLRLEFPPLSSKRPSRR